MQEVRRVEPYGQIRTISASIRLDRQYLENAPLGKNKKRQLERRIEDQVERLRKMRKEFRVQGLIR